MGLIARNETIHPGRHIVDTITTAIDWIIVFINEGVRERTGGTNVQHWLNKTTPNALWFNRIDVIN